MSNTSKSSRYEVALSLVLFLMIVAYLTGNVRFAQAGFALGFLTLVSTWFADKLVSIWQKIIAVVGFVNSHILLSLIFFIVLVPISFIYRLFNKDALNLKGGKASYYAERSHTYTSDDLKNPW